MKVNKNLSKQDYKFVLSVMEKINRYTTDEYKKSYFKKKI